MPRTLLSFALALLVSASAFAALTPEEEARIKASATAITKNASASQGKFGATGTLQRDANGAPVTSQASASNTPGQLEYVKGLYGVEAVSATGNPAAGGATGGSVQSARSLDFQCGQDENRTKSAGGVTVKFVECLGQAPTGLKIALCDAPLSGGVCNTEAYVPVTLAAGRFLVVKTGLEAGFACNSAKACRVTIRNDFTRVATGATLASQTQDAAAAPSGLASKLRDTYTSDGYEKHYETTGRDMSKCVQGVNESMAADGTVTTCAGNTTVDVGGQTGVSGGESCTDSWTCIREATQTATYAKSCTRTFPLTALSCSWTVPTMECAVTRANGVTTSSCTDASLAGGDLAKTSAETCTSNAADGSCATATWTEYYTFMDKATRVGDCTTSPAPVRGSVTTACAAGGSGTFSACEADGWWLRTLSETECTSDTVKDGQSTLVALTGKEKAGCGVCVKPIATDICDAQPTTQEPEDSCGWIDPACGAPVSITPESTTFGRVESQREDYVCSVSETSCVERKRETTCVSTDRAKGMDALPVQTASNQAVMNDALASAAVVDEISKSVGSNKTGTLPLIFGAEDSRCKKPAGYATSYSNDCCKINLQKPGGDAVANECQIAQVELAGSRRANRTHYVGDYCSKEVGIGKWKKCVEKTQTYCEYTGLLSRLLQEQGRPQLAAMAASPLANPSRSTMTFGYYGAVTGSWTKPIELNGIKVAAWQTPSACQSPNSPGATEVSCPSILTQWFAACERSTGCGDLPYTPEAGSDTWTLGATDPLSPKLTALSHSTTVEGACDTATASCQYNVTALPSASGGRARVTRSLNFYLTTQDAAGKAVQGGSLGLGDTMMRPYSQPGPIGAVSTPVPVEVSLNGGQSWSTATLPQKIQGSTKLPGTDLDVTGGCDPIANMCSYQVTGLVSVHAKPWGSPKNPDCTGFTVGQLSLLDFSKMDLSEWIASVMGKLSAPDVKGLAESAAQEGQRYYEVYQGVPGADAAPVGQTATAPTGAKTADVSPREGWGPFNVLLRVTSNYPQIFTSTADGQPDPALNTDPVHAVEVDWGDCTMKVTASPFNGVIEAYDPATKSNKSWPASGFTATHQYLAPDQIACTDRGMKNISHTVRIIVHSKSGIHETTSLVRNLWTGATAPSGVGDGAGGRSAVIIKQTR